MQQEDFDYDSKLDNPKRRRTSLDIFSDDVGFRAEIERDVEGLAFAIRRSANHAAVFKQDVSSAADVTILDCKDIDDDCCEQLAAFDKKVAKSNHYLIVSTNLANLDRVFGCFRESRLRGQSLT
ncbi:hypothetical protein [Pseudopontixanthobacter vadosimaris]|uniref:hypothetical protein n=1 Tax=Pseudopontixanthobacter vadosimaris TaxID=2726450 RepID=UPI001475820C|nr:hypothetical protein [Pseudopontixanthobacter vadosimaris]